MFGSSLAVKSRETIEEATLQQGRAASLDTEVSRLQKLSSDLEQQLAEARAREQQVGDEVAKVKAERDAFSDSLTKAGLLVEDLRGRVERAGQLAVEEFKSSSDYAEAVESSSSRYFGDGFDFCKRQLRHHHPDLAIDLEEMRLDLDLLALEDEGEGEGEGEGGEEETVEKGDANPPGDAAPQGEDNPPFIINVICNVNGHEYKR